MDVLDVSRPKPVESAVYILSAALAIGLLRILFSVDFSTLAVDPLLFYGLLFGVNAVIGLLLYKIWSGKNWARITFAVLFLLGMIKTVPALKTAIDASVFTGVLSAAIIAAQLVAIALLFLSSSNTWFRHARL